MEIPVTMWSATKTRLADRSLWPRKWWWPLPEKINISDEDWKKQHDEISKAINKLLLVLIGFCFFCALALGAPDASLLASNAMITLPFASVKISFVSFLIIAPLVLAAFSFYLHIFAAYWITLSRQRPATTSGETLHPELPFVFNLQSRTANWLSKFLFYWLVPVILGDFARRALPRPGFEGPVLISLTSAFIAVFLFLQLRRRSDRTRKIPTILLWSGLLSSILIIVLIFHEGKSLPRRSLNLNGADLSQQDLKGLNLEGADLSNAHLQGANLSLADLNGAHLKAANLTLADLTLANLTHADLEGAHLKGAALGWANLTHANLTHADLEGANLTHADLNSAILFRADLEGANLFAADLTGAILHFANLNGLDLSGVHGLTQEHGSLAIGDEKTQLPPGISEPELWKKKPMPTPPTPPN